MANQAAAAAYNPPKINPWIVAPTVGLAAFMEVLDISIANVALQHIAGSLSASQDESTWVLTSYLVTNAIVLPMSGWLSSVIGRRRYFLGCIIGFSVTSLLCGLAPSLPLLILARALQGITGGGLQPNAQAILADAFPPHKRGQAFAAYGIAVVVAPATLGGWITDNYSWRWVFLLNVPVGVLLTLLASRVIHDSPAQVAARTARLREKLRFDYIGFALLVVGMCSLQIVLDKGQEDDWWSSRFILYLTIAATVSLIAFVVWELQRPDPIVDLRLLKHRNFAVGNLLMFMLGFILLGSTVLLPQFVQLVLGYTATEAGLVISPGGFAVMVMMPIVGNLVSRVDARWLIAIGLSLCGVSLYDMTLFTLDIGEGRIVWNGFLQGLGLGLVFPPLTTLAFATIPARIRTEGAAMNALMRNLGASVGVAVLVALLGRNTQINRSVLAENLTVFNPLWRFATTPAEHGILVDRSRILSYMTPFGGAWPFGSVPTDDLPKLTAMWGEELNRQASMISYLNDFRVLAISTLIFIPLLFFMRRQAGFARPSRR